MIKSVKSQVRSKFLKQRRQFARDNNINKISLAICRRASDYLKQYDRVAIYYETHEEVATALLDEHITHTYYPKIKKNEICFIHYNRDDLRGMPKNKWDIPEPIGKFAPLSEIECVVVPAVAFDVECNRLGYGGGFYDRALCHYAGDIVGLAYDFQIIESIPTVPYDVPVNKIFTEKRELSNASKKQV